MIFQYNCNNNLFFIHLCHIVNCLKEISRILKPGGKLLQSVPFGKAYVFNNRGFKVFDYPQIESTYGKTSEEYYFIKKPLPNTDQHHWSACSREEAEIVDHANLPKVTATIISLHSKEVLLNHFSS